MLAMSKFYHHHLFFSVALGVVAVLFHVGVLFVFLIAGLLADVRLKFIRWLKLITLVLLGVLTQYYLVDILGYLTEANMPSGLDAKGKWLIKVLAPRFDYINYFMVVFICFTRGQKAECFVNQPTIFYINLVNTIHVYIGKVYLCWA